jgi:hypothetical protein
VQRLLPRDEPLAQPGTAEDVAEVAPETPGTTAAHLEVR